MIGPFNAFLPGFQRPALGLLLLGASQAAAAQSCSVALGATLAFSNVVALASGGNPSTDSGQSFKISCDAAVTGPLRLYSATPRMMRNSVYNLPFNLSLSSGANSDDLAPNARQPVRHCPRRSAARGDALRKNLGAKFQGAAGRTDCIPLRSP